MAGWLVVAGLLAGPVLGELRTSDCLAPANPTIQENCRPGNTSTVWDVNADGDPSIQVGGLQCPTSPHHHPVITPSQGHHPAITWSSHGHHLAIT